VLELNLLAAFDLSRFAHTAFRAAGRGNIVGDCFSPFDDENNGGDRPLRLLHDDRDDTNACGIGTQADA
jgi:hypothetical protein